MRVAWLNLEKIVFHYIYLLATQQVCSLFLFHHINKNGEL